MRAVITGGPSVGKTTIISQLSQRGFKVVEEFATQIIKEGQVLPWVDRIGFQEEVLKRQLAAEAELQDYEGPVFLDRGSIDGEAYYIYDRLEIPAVFRTIDPSVYSIAFLIEELPFFDKNDVRWENLEFTRALTKVLELCYRRRNIDVVRVPAMDPIDRTNFVVAEFEKHCLKIAKDSVEGKRAKLVPQLYRAFAV